MQTSEPKLTMMHQKGLAILGLDKADARVLVVGLGVTGLSVIRFLQQNHIKTAVVDSREKPPGLNELEESCEGIAVYTGGFNEDVFAVATHLIMSPGVSLQEKEIQRAIDRGVSVLGDIDIFSVCAKAPIVGITGSNGKSTVTTLLGDMALQAQWDVRLGGNLGTPALDLLSIVEPDLYILELSSFQLETRTFLKTKAAAVLNISPDHMDRYADVQAYSVAKARVLKAAEGAVLNRADQRVMAMKKDCTGIAVTFALDVPEEGQYGVIKTPQGCFLAKGKERLVSTDELKIKGSHNIENALAAMALADALSIPNVAQKNALNVFAGLPHRTQWVAEINHVSWVNDSKATNPGACLAAIEGLQGPLVLLVGGDGKGADFGVLKEAVKKHVSWVVLMGQDAKRFKREVIVDTPFVFAENMEEAVAAAAEAAQPGDTVLLSPACASLDQYKSYQQRGDRYIEAVRVLKS